MESDTQLGQGTSFMRGCIDTAEYRVDVAPNTFNLIAPTIHGDRERWVRFNDGFGWYNGEEATAARRDPRPGHQEMYIRWQELRSLISKWASSH